jgi:hypothetical protein
MSYGIPILPVIGSNYADAPIYTKDMGCSFTKGAKEFIIKFYESGEGVVLGPVPYPFHRHDHVLFGCDLGK